MRIAKASANPATISRTRFSAARARASSNSTVASSRRVRPSSSSAEAKCATELRRSRRVRGGVPAVTAARVLPAIHQQADQETNGCRNADRTPRIVVDVVVGEAGRRLGMVERPAFVLLQLELGAKQIRLDLRTQVARLVACLRGGTLQHFLRLGKDGGHFVDEPFAAVFSLLGHGGLLVQTRATLGADNPDGLYAARVHNSGPPSNPRNPMAKLPAL